MKIIRGTDLPYIPASHENAANPGVVKKVLFTLPDFITPSHIQMMNWAKLPVGRSFAEHYHEDMEEVFIIIRGIAEVRVGNKEVTVSGGDALLIPERKRHSMRNIGHEDVEYIAIGNSRGKHGKTRII